MSCESREAIAAPLVGLYCWAGWGHYEIYGLQRFFSDNTLRCAVVEKSAPAVAVIDGSGRLVGLVTSETVGEMLMLHEALPAGARLGPWTRPTGA